MQLPNLIIVIFYKVPDYQSRRLRLTIRVSLFTWFLTAFRTYRWHSHRNLTFDGLKIDIFKRCEEIFVFHQAAVTGFPIAEFDHVTWIRSSDVMDLDPVASGLFG